MLSGRPEKKQECAKLGFNGSSFSVPGKGQKDISTQSEEEIAAAFSVRASNFLRERIMITGHYTHA